MTEKSRSSSRARREKGGTGRDPHAVRESEKYAAPIASREYILETLRDEKGPLDLETLGVRLGLDSDADATEALRRRVRAMIRDGQLIENRRRGLVPVDDSALVAGRISAHPDGFGFLVSDEREKDVFLSAREMRQVLHGDKVVVNITGEDRRGRPEGRIVNVVERANHSLVGRLSVEHGIAKVAADSKRIHQDLLIEPGQRNGAEHGDMVVAEITEQPSRRQQPVGKVVEVLGQHLTPGMEIDVALHTHGIPVDWPEAVTTQAATFSTTVQENDVVGRKDVRSLPLVTIDGADARDFDDAVWCEPADDGWRLIVAIADVANYVVPGSALDDEAIARGTSVYFPGRVVPMLPEVLSNGLCSLNPDVDRLCMLCEMTLDTDGKVVKARFHNGVLRSHARLTYSKVHEILTEPDSALREEYASLVPMIENLHTLYKVLAKARRKRGAIEFDSNETRIVFDDERKIEEIVPVVRNDAHKLIEECMILANIQAAAFLETKEIPALFRVHAGPKADRLEDLRSFLALHGLQLGGGATPSALDYAKLADDIKDRPDRSVIQTVMLRSMQQAVYQPKNEGHFGLALEQYAHFTSPIRRYPDLLVHRAIKHAISREKNASYRYSPADMQGLGETCSQYERRAEDASRDVVSWLKCEYMQQHVGSEFSGVVSAVTSFGLFVELKGIHIEGLIHITSLSRDYYKFDQAAHALFGERTGQQYHLGDTMVVRVAAVNLDERKIDFSEVSHQAVDRPSSVLQAVGAAAGGSGKQADPSSEKGQRKRRKGRKRREGKRGHTPETTMAAAEGHHPKVVAASPGSNAPAGGAQSDRSEGSPGGKPMNPEHRRQEKRRAKQRRRDAKRAACMAEKKAAAADKHSQPSTVSGEKADSASARKAASRKGASGKANEKKATEEKAVEEKATDRKSAARKKAARKKVTAQKSTAREPAAKMAATDKAAGKNVIAQEPAERKATGKRAVVRKSSAQNADARKETARSTTAKKTAVRKGASTAATANKSAAQSATADKSAARSGAAKEVIAKKAAARKTTATKAGAEQAGAQKATARKVTSKKATSKKAATGKASSKEATARSATAQPVAARKTTAKKASSKKASSKKAAAKKAASKQTVAGKTAARKVTATGSSAKKVATKKAAAGRTGESRATTKKATAKKAATKKTVTKKAVTKKGAATKKSAASRKRETKATTHKSASGVPKKPMTKKTAAKRAVSKKTSTRT